MSSAHAAEIAELEVAGAATTRAGFNRLRRLILGLRMGLTLAVLAGAGLQAWYEQQHQLERATLYADSLAAAVEDHARASLDTIASTLRFLDADGLANASPAEQLHRLQEHQHSLPGASALFLVNSSGELVAHSSKTTGDVHERDFWRAQSQPGAPALFVGRRQPALGGPLTDILPLTLRLQHGERFAGLLGASLSTSYFQDFFLRLKPEYQAGYVILRQGEPVLDSGRMPDSSARLQVRRELPEYGLTVQLYIPKAVVLAQARLDVLRQMALALFVVLALWAICGALLRRLRQQEDILYHARRAEAGLASSQQATLWVQPDGRLQSANAAASRLLGRSSQELEQQHIYQVFGNLDSDAWRRHWRHLQGNKAGLLDLYWRHNGDEPVQVSLSTHHVAFDGFEYALVFLSNLDSRRMADMRLRQIFRHAREYLALFQLDEGERFVLTEANRPRLAPGADADEEVLGVGEELRHVATARLGLKPAQVDFLQAMFRACATARRPMSFGASVDLGLGEQYHTINLSPVVDERGVVEAVLLGLRNSDDQHRLLDTLELEIRRLQAELRQRARPEAPPGDQA